MDKQKIDKLILRLIDNSISEEESNELASWLEQSCNLKYFNDFIQINQLLNTKNKFDHRHSLNEYIKRSHNLNKRLKIRIMYAAATIVFFISIALVFNKRVSENKVIVTEIVSNEIKVGGDKAILTKEDGSTVILQKGHKYVSDNLESFGTKLVYQDYKTNKVENAFNILTIPRGGQYFVELSDGTKVWLNSESQLRYPVSFEKGKIRQVELVYGEAYFDVSPSTEHGGSKFNVYNKSQEIEVLGTEFNIKAYKDESNVFTTLVEGKVLIFYDNKNQILKPNQQANLNINNKTVHIDSINVYDEISWKEGVFSFHRKSLSEIMKVLSRWYDIDVIINDSKIENSGFNGVLGKDQKIKDVLNIIRGFGVIKEYEINGKTVILK